MVKSKGNKKANNNGRQGKQAAAPAPPGHAGTQSSYQAHASRGSGVQTLSTLANATQTVKRIEVMDNPGENHFAEALAKALGPMAKDPTARSQIVALVSRLEPEAAVSGFSNSNSTDPMQMLLLQVLAQSASQVQNNAVGGPGTQNSSDQCRLLALFQILQLYPILGRWEPVVALPTPLHLPTPPRLWRCY